MSTMDTARITGSQWRDLADDRITAGNLIYLGLVACLLGVGFGLVSALDSWLSAWLVIGPLCGGGTFVWVGSMLRANALAALRALPRAERQLALEYIQGEYQLRQDLAL